MRLSLYTIPITRFCHIDPITIGAITNKEFHVKVPSPSHSMLLVHIWYTVVGLGVAYVGGCNCSPGGPLRVTLRAIPRRMILA